MFELDNLPLKKKFFLLVVLGFSMFLGVMVFDQVRLYKQTQDTVNNFQRVEMDVDTLISIFEMESAVVKESKLAKDVWIRGVDPKDLEKYRSEFMANVAGFHRNAELAKQTIAILAEKSPQMFLPYVARVNECSNQHDEAAQVYLAQMHQYVGTPATLNAKVIGIDRAPTECIAKLRNEFDLFIEARLNEKIQFSLADYAGHRNATLLTTIFLLVGLLALSITTMRDIRKWHQLEKAAIRKEEVEVLYRLTSEIGQASNLEQIFNGVMNVIESSLKVDRVAILLRDKNGKPRFQAWRNLSETYRQAADGHSPWDRSVQHPEAIWIEDIGQDVGMEYFRPVAYEEGIRAFGFVPLIINGRLLGKFMLYYNHPHNFSEDECKLANSIALHLSLAIERQLHVEDIERLAYYDSLTGLPNRRLLLEHLRQAVAATQRNMLHGAICFIDLDHFKQINDTRGHEVGDQLLQEVGRRLKAAVREGDMVARMGGDEFIVLLDSLSQDHAEAAGQAMTVAMKLRQLLDITYLIQQEEFSVTSSIGIRLFKGNEHSIGTLLKQADSAMYHAKASGRNTVHFYDKSLQSAIEAHFEMEQALRRALRNEEFRVYYQPQIFEDGIIQGVEALVRWEHPTKGLIPPGEFIPVAEESGLIDEIGWQVMDIACKQMAEHNRHRASPLVVAVNVSAYQFKQPHFMSKLRQIIRNTGIDPTWLKLELTESVVLNHLGEAVAKMDEIRKLGIGISLDDFGTGYSSLAYLAQLPLTELKIDQSFVRRFSETPQQRILVQSILMLGRTFGLKVVAEGIESREQHQLLLAEGCFYFQGYLFGYPMPTLKWQ